MIPENLLKWYVMEVIIRHFTLRGETALVFRVMGNFRLWKGPRNFIFLVNSKLRGSGEKNYVASATAR
jgi:hypothetical protein